MADIPWQMWSLIPASPSPEAGELGPLPSYQATRGQSPIRAQNTEYERDDFGTVVTEVTTITTRKRYRVEDA